MKDAMKETPLLIALVERDEDHKDAPTSTAPSYLLVVNNPISRQLELPTVTTSPDSSSNSAATAVEVCLAKWLPGCGTLHSVERTPQPQPTTADLQKSGAVKPRPLLSSDGGSHGAGLPAGLVVAQVCAPSSVIQQHCQPSRHQPAVLVPVSPDTAQTLQEYMQQYALSDDAQHRSLQGGPGQEGQYRCSCEGGCTCSSVVPRLEPTHWRISPDLNLLCLGLSLGCQVSNKSKAVSSSNGMTIPTAGGDGDVHSLSAAASSRTFSAGSSRRHHSHDQQLAGILINGHQPTAGAGMHHEYDHPLHSTLPLDSAAYAAAEVSSSILSHYPHAAPVHQQRRPGKAGASMEVARQTGSDEQHWLGQEGDEESYDSVTDSDSGQPSMQVQLPPHLGEQYLSTCGYPALGADLHLPEAGTWHTSLMPAGSSASPSRLQTTFQFISPADQLQALSEYSAALKRRRAQRSHAALGCGRHILLDMNGLGSGESSSEGEEEEGRWLQALVMTGGGMGSDGVLQQGGMLAGSHQWLDYDGDDGGEEEGAEYVFQEEQQHPGGEVTALGPAQQTHGSTEQHQKGQAEDVGQEEEQQQLPPGRDMASHRVLSCSHQWVGGQEEEVEEEASDVHLEEELQQQQLLGDEVNGLVPLLQTRGIMREQEQEEKEDVVQKEEQQPSAPDHVPTAPLPLQQTDGSVEQQDKGEAAGVVEEHQQQEQQLPPGHEPIVLVPPQQTNGSAPGPVHHPPLGPTSLHSLVLKVDGLQAPPGLQELAPAGCISTAQDAQVPEDDDRTQQGSPASSSEHPQQSTSPSPPQLLGNTPSTLHTSYEQLPCELHSPPCSSPSSRGPIRVRAAGPSVLQAASLMAKTAWQVLSYICQDRAHAHYS